MPPHCGAAVTSPDIDESLADVNEGSRPRRPFESPVAQSVQRLQNAIRIVLNLAERNTFRARVATRERMLRVGPGSSARARLRL